MKRSLAVVVPWLLLCLLFAASGCGDVGPSDPPTESSVSLLANEVLMKPTSDVAADAVVGVSNDVARYADVDDGTAFSAADDDGSYVRGQGGAPSADHTVGYSGAPSGKVASVTVYVRASHGTTTGRIAVELYDGATKIGTGAAHTLGAAYADYTDSFSGLSVASANTLRTKVVLTNTGSSGSVRYTQIFVKVGFATSVVCPGTPPRANLVLRYPGNGAVFKRDRLQGPPGGPFTRDVRADGSASTAGTGGPIVSYAYTWWDGTASPAGTASAVDHTYEYNLGTSLNGSTHAITPAYKNGLGLKKISLTVKDACGNTATATQRAVILRDHVGFGDWNPQTTAEHDENVVNRGLDVQDIVTSVINHDGVITPSEPLAGARAVLESNQNGYGYRHRIPARLIHLNKIDPDQSSYNVTWFHVLNDRHSPPYSGPAGTYPSWPKDGNYNVDPATGKIDPTRTWSYTNPKPSIWFKQQFLNWKLYGEPFYFNVADEANTHVDDNQAYWNDANRAAADKDISPTITGATWANMVSEVIGWMDEVEVYNCAGFLIGLTSSGFDNSFATDNLPLITNDWEFLALSGYNYFNKTQKWKPFRDIVEKPLLESRALGKTLFYWESGCDQDASDKSRRGTWFLDAGDVLRGAKPFTGTGTSCSPGSTACMSDLDNEVIVFNSGEGKYMWDMDAPTESAIRTISHYATFTP